MLFVLFCFGFVFCCLFDIQKKIQVSITTLTTDRSSILKFVVFHFERMVASLVTKKYYFKGNHRWVIWCRLLQTSMIVSIIHVLILITLSCANVWWDSAGTIVKRKSCLVFYSHLFDQSIHLFNFLSHFFIISFVCFFVCLSVSFLWQKGLLIKTMIVEILITNIFFI